MSSWAEGALIVVAALNLFGFCLLAFSLFAIYRQIRDVRNRIDRILDSAEGVVETVKEAAHTVAQRADAVSGEVASKAQRIAQLSEDVAERVAQRVDTTTFIVQEAISKPMVNLASVRAGVGKGLEVWQELSKAKGGNGK